MENVVLTPHIIAITDLALINMVNDSAEGILDVLEGQTPNTW